MGEGDPSTEDALMALQRDIAFWMGRCVLRLQRYEHLIKAMVDRGNLSVQYRASDEGVAATPEVRRFTTLGILVQDFLSGSLAKNAPDGVPEKEVERDRPGNWIDIRSGIALSEQEFARVEQALRELVALRNSLVHNFINEHDTDSVEGCTAARDALQDAYRKIDVNLAELRDWARTLDSVHQMFSDLLKSEEVISAIVSGRPIDWNIRLPPDATAD